MELMRLLDKKVKPKAERFDWDPKALRKGLKLLGKHKLLAQRASKEYGGNALDSKEYFSFLELFQSYSGALGFLQRQHQAAARFISNSDQTNLKQEWIPLMVKGKRRVGVSVSHLRAPATPCVEAYPVQGGWSLTGHVHWVSGYRIFDWLVIGFFCPEEGLEGMGIVRFKKGRCLKVTKVLKTIAITSTQTLSIELKDLFLEEAHVISIKPIGSYGESSDPLNVQFVNLSALALGFLREVEAPTLQDQYETCRQTFLARGADPALYAEMNRIATYLSHIARFTRGTRGLICPNSVERRCRELMLFSVILPSKKIAEQCLKRIL